MIIDFHTHAFPDALAVKTIPMLAEKSGTVPHTDGTADGLAAVLSNPEMMEKLNAAGLQTLIADAQEQLDTHLGK